MRETFGSWMFHMAANRRWRGAANAGSDGLSAGGDRLALSTTNLATASRRIASKKITTERKKWYLFGGVCDSIGRIDTGSAGLPSDIETLKVALIVERAKALEAAPELAIARAKASQDMALIAHQKLRIARLERQLYGQRSERSGRLIEQSAFVFEELRAEATEDKLVAEAAIARTTSVTAFTCQRAERNTFSEHQPHERVVIDPPIACECCGGNRLRKLGEDVTRTLETRPRQ